MLCRLRIGHTFATHRYLLCREERPRCPHCAETLTVRHVLVSCRRLDAERVRFFGSCVLSLRKLLDDDSEVIPQVFCFLANAHFFAIYSSVS